ncbi:MAG TPA: NAD(P)H-binding protein [Bryobacteraceae bacterium]|nr:NAD(P)H-binding protein [Bryobacteraceae bacterium]
MKVVLFGATGMVGQGVLRECLADPEVESVLSIGRNRTDRQHPKLREVIQTDFVDFPAVAPELRGCDACFFCLGVSSAGMSEERYRRVTYDLTMTAAQTLARVSPDMTFIYVSGMGTDSSEHGRTMWARVKGQTENALLRLPFKAAYMFRPGLIVPLDGIRSKTRLYSMFYAAAGPLIPWLYARFPKYVTTTRQIGLAMLTVAKRGAPAAVLENADINRV